MSSKELREQVAAIKHGDNVTARLKAPVGTGDYTVMGEAWTNGGPSARWLAVGHACLRLTNGDSNPDLLAIVSHEPAKPPLPPEPKGDVVISTNAGWFFTPTERGWKRDDQIDNAMSWGAVAGQYPDFTVYRPEPSPGRVEELVERYQHAVFASIGTARRTELLQGFAEELLGGGSGE